jgi:hypothetical protein
VNKWIRVIITLTIIIVPLSMAVAQDSTPTTDTPPTLEPTPVVILVPEITEQDIMLAGLRSDIEMLADLSLSFTRPDGWSGNTDTSDPQMALLVRIDLEFLAGSLLGEITRPDGWFGAVSSTSYFVSRDIRHDMELLANTVLGPTTRPAGWAGDDPLLNCDRSTQALVGFLSDTNDLFNLQANRAAPDFCQQAATEVSVFVELNFLSNPGSSGDNVGDLGVIRAASIQSDFAVGFLDRSALVRGGVIPNGTLIEPIARSYTSGSNMILVSGQGFEAYIDYQFSSITYGEYFLLPNVDEVGESPFCTADWCE